MPKIGVLYSSFNNYDLFEGESLRRINFGKNPIVNVDDYSYDDEQKKGRYICEKHKIPFFVNPQKGMHSAVEFGVNYFSEKYNSEWILVLQQDVFPLGNFFDELSTFLNKDYSSQIGALGFNNLEKDNYFTKESYKKYLKKGSAEGLLGSFFLSDTKSRIRKLEFHMFVITSILNTFGTKKYKEKSKLYTFAKRVFSETHFNNFLQYFTLYQGISSIELPAWAAIAINIKLWKKHIKPCSDYTFHLWFNDIAMQFLSRNVNLATASDLYVLNDQSIKEKYGFNRCSAAAGKSGDTNHVEGYGNHLDIFKSRWGFCYEDVIKTFESQRYRYQGTLVEKYFDHDCRSGPLVKYN